MLRSGRIDALSPALLVGMASTALLPSGGYVFLAVLLTFVIISLGYIVLLPSMQKKDEEFEEGLSNLLKNYLSGFRRSTPSSPEEEEVIKDAIRIMIRKGAEHDQ